MKYVAPFMILLFLLSCSHHSDNSGKYTKNIPSYARNAVVYELFIRDFTPEGTFQAARQKIPYLKNLGVDIVWIMPIYPIGEKGRKGSLGSPYSVKNYFEVNPEFGTKEDFKRLVQEIHHAGMKVIIGFVPNHSANDYVEMEKHPDWFMRDSQGNFTREVKDWSDITDFNYDNPELRKHIISIMKYWIENFDIDGYRCDVAGMVPDDFWKEAVLELRKVKPDLFLLAEWEDYKFIRFGFTADYSWKLLHTMKDVHAGNKGISSLMEVFRSKYEHYFPSGMFLNFLENHDEPRSVQIFGKNHIQPFASFIFTIPGIPLLLMGQEFGDTSYSSWRSLFEKEPINWAQFDSSLYKMYRRLIELRHTFPFNEAKFDVILNSNRQNLLIYALNYRQKTVLVAVNLSDKDQSLDFTEFISKYPYLSGNYQNWYSGNSVSIRPGISLSVKPNTAVILYKE
jgi:glycosidase